MKAAGMEGASRIAVALSGAIATPWYCEPADQRCFLEYAEQLMLTVSLNDAGVVLWPALPVLACIPPLLLPRARRRLNHAISSFSI